MAEEKDSTYKVTDRRKFNADGTPRDEPASDQAAPAPSQPQATEPAAGAGLADNVISFPSEAERKKEPAASAPASALGGAQSQPSGTGTRPAAPSAAATASEQAYQQAKRATPTSLPQASFLSLVNMLAVETAVSLGLVETQDQGSPVVDLETARHMIDLLGVVQQKTRGNLSAEEDNLLDNVLADLRMQFVARSKKQ